MHAKSIALAFVSRAYHGRMSSSPEVYPKIQPIDPTTQKLCHCGTKAKWTASLRLEGAQILPASQNEDLCDDHAEKFAADHGLKIPPADRSVARKSKVEHS